MRIFVKEGFTVERLEGATMSFPAGFFYDLDDDLALEYLDSGQAIVATEDNQAIEVEELVGAIEPTSPPQESGAGGDIALADTESTPSDVQESGSGGDILDHDAFTPLEAPQESGAGGDIILSDGEE